MQEALPIGQVADLANLETPALRRLEQRFEHACVATSNVTKASQLRPASLPRNKGRLGCGRVPAADARGE